MEHPDLAILRAHELVAALPSVSATDLAELAGLALGDLRAHERDGGDMVGTDAYPVVRAAWPALAALVEGGAPDQQVAAAYLLAFLLEPADQTLPRLEAAAAAATAPAVQAGLQLAAARLAASVAVLRGTAPRVPHEGIALDERARGAAPLRRAVGALGQVFGLPDFPRKVQPEVAEALDALTEDVAVGPWGGGSLREVIAAVRGTLWVVQPKAELVARPAPAPQADAGAANLGDAEVADPYTQQRPERQPPRVVLAGLRDVDWAALEHAYGDARGVPGMLDGLSSPAAADRAWAIDALGASIHHQGSVYSASTAAVPFLIRLAAEAGLEGRARILDLLCGIAVHQPGQCLVAGARRWRSEAYGAVVAGGPTYVALLADGDAAVRTAAAYLLAYVDPPPAGALEALRAALASERDRRARASELLAIGYVSRYLGSVVDRALLIDRLDDDAPLLRGAAALALLQLAGTAAPAEARQVLARLPGECARVRGFFPWAGGDLAGFARTVRLAFQSNDELWAEVDAALAGGGAPDDAGGAAGRLYGRLFFDDVHRASRPWLPAELDAPRRKLLRYYVETTPRQASGHTLVPFWEGANDAGLFSQLDSIERLLGDHPGPLDRELTLDGEVRPAWAWIIARTSDQLAAGVLPAALAAWPTADRLALVDDALGRAYQLTQPRWHVEYGSDDDDPHSPAAANDFTSRALGLLAELAGSDAEAAGWARAHADAQLARGGKRDARIGLIAAIVLARAAAGRGEEVAVDVDRLCGFDLPPASTYRAALREVLRLLPPARAERLVLTQPLYAYQAYVDPRGEVRRWTNRGGWAVLDCAPPPVVAREVLGALREWQRHLGAGDDPHAVPVLGTTTSSIESKPRADQRFPRDRAIALLAGAGDAAVAALDAALAEGTIADRELLTTARAAALAAGN